MTMNRSDALTRLNQAGRGNANEMEALLRALITGDFASRVEPPAAGGITAGVGTVYKTSCVKIGDIYRSAILIDLTGLGAIATDLDIIGVGANPAHFGQWTRNRNGYTPFSGRMTCLEVPTGASADIDLYYATEATGILDGGIAALAETALITAGGAWTLALTKAFADPAALLEKYFYLTNGAAANAGTYTAGKFLIEMEGYDP